jgi:serine/threonine protein kinase/ABC-type glycerol-3-phosphate transport system substrate-binding protein
MEFCVLGNLEARRAGVSVSLGSLRQRSLLALLLMHANTVVSTDSILDELWGDDLGTDRQNSLWVHVSNLRSALEPDRPRRSEGTIVLTRPPGYVVQIGAGQLDAWRFEELLQEGRDLLEPDSAAASMVIGEALAMWRGRAYEEFTYHAFAQAEVARLEELRLEAVELRLDADLRRGLASQLVGELEGLVRTHRQRERLTALLMVALYRSGRTSDALRAYQRLRLVLADEVGIDPGPDLKELETRILAGDAALQAGVSATQPRTRLAVRGYELRERLGEGALGPAFRAYQPLVGREVAVRVVRAELADDPDFIRRFEAQGELVARLEHPHIVPVYDYWREPGAAYLVTRLFGRGSLDDALQAAALEPQRAGQLVRDVASALSMAHSRGVVHGAVMPSSILIDDEGRGYIGAFANLGDSGLGPDPLSVEPPYAPPECIAGGPVTPRSDVYGLGFVLSAALGQQPPGAFADVIAHATAEDPGDRFPSMALFVAAVDAALGTTALTTPVVIENPYKGLHPFEEADAPLFFGRDRIVERLLNRIGDGGHRGRLVVLVGPSGSGKSSIVRAGLIPALRRGAAPGSAEWFLTHMTPGAEPFESLAESLLRVAVDPPSDLRGQLLHSTAGFRHAVRDVLPDPDAQLLLVIDQFEELFTQASDRSARDFLGALVEAVREPGSRVRIVVALRADFYDRPLVHPTLGELVRRGTEVVTPMTAQELERAINGPAEQNGVRFEPSLLAEMVAEVSDRPGALPLLQFALSELFDRRSGSLIDLETYRDMGGVSGALVHTAESLFQAFDGEAKWTARQILLRLVVIADDSTQIARRRVQRQELLGLRNAAVDAVLERFEHHRLLTFDRDPGSRAPTVEVAHEALLTEWARLHNWIEEARDDLRHRRQLTRRADEWVGGDKDDAYLLRGTQLERFAAWAAVTDLAIAPSERALIEASRQRHDDERSDKAHRLRHEQELRRTARRRAQLIAAIGAVLVVVVALASFALVQRRDAERLSNEAAALADARRLARDAAVVANDDPELAMLVALQSLEESARAGIGAPVDSEEALHWALQAARIPYPVEDAPFETRIGPRGITGIYRLPLPDLVALVRANVDRPLTPAECTRFEIDPCPSNGEGLASPASAGSRTVPAELAARPPRSGADAPLAGTTIVLADFGDPDEATQAVQARFQEVTGIRVVYRSRFPNDLAPDVLDRDPPDVIAVPAPQFRDPATTDVLVDLASYVDVGAAREHWGDYLVGVAVHDGRLLGLPSSLGVKGLVWYPKAAFAAAGYTIPHTWDELIGLSNRIVADGGTPLCMGLESGGDGAWPATDWVEALVLRVGGVDLYDGWMAHEIPFTDPRIAEATARFGQVMFAEGFVRGGPQASARQTIFEAFDPMLDQPPGCWFSYSADYFPNLAREGAVAGVDYDFFVLPPLRPGGDAPVFGEASMLAAVTDRPEVREFLRHMMDPDAIAAWAASTSDIVIPAHVDLNTSSCADPRGDPRTNDLRIRLCEATRQTVAAGLFRFDASDLMPPEIGLPAMPGERGQFLQGMLDYVNEGQQSLAEVLANIDAAWPP